MTDEPEPLPPLTEAEILAAIDRCDAWPVFRLLDQAATMLQNPWNMVTIAQLYAARQHRRKKRCQLPPGRSTVPFTGPVEGL